MVKHNKSLTSTIERLQRTNNTLQETLEEKERQVSKEKYWPFFYCMNLSIYIKFMCVLLASNN